MKRRCCACGFDEASPKDGFCEVCWTRTTLMPVIKDWLRTSDDADTRAMRGTCLAYIESLEARLEKKGAECADEVGMVTTTCAKIEAEEA